MDHAYFGLQQGLFGDGIATDTAVFRGLKHDRVIAHFKLALDSPNSVVVLRGPAGIGKTTLTAAALRASSTRLALAWLNGMPTNAAELLELVLVDLGVNTVRTTRMERLQLWRQFQAETRATESRLFVVVERTEDLSPEVLHALDQLTAPDAVGNPGANLVLLGHATIDEHLAAPLLESLRQRIRVRAELTPFTEAELQDYLRHQVACAGGHYDHIFAPGTVAALHRYSGGVARLANTLCKSTLDIAASQRQKPLTPELVTKTAVSLLGLGEGAPPMRVAPPAPSREAAPVATNAPVVPTAPTIAPTASVAVTPAAAPPIPPVAVATPAPAVVAPAPSPAPSPVAPRAQTPNVIPVAVPVSVAAPAPATTIAAARAPAPAAILQPTAAPAVTAAKPASVAFEFDGAATDISDVAVADFPVLTDAVEPTTAAATKRATPAVPPQAEPAPLPSRVTAARPAAAPRAPAPTSQPVAPALSRLETAYTKAALATAPAAPKPAPPAAAAAAPKPAPAPRTPPAAPADDDDLLRQTQTMRAIAVAKSIDDISSSMAETLFGDAELDLVTAALASAADWPEDDEQATPAASVPEPPRVAPKAAAQAEPVKPAAPVDDPFDLFGLGDDAPLELIDDSTLPPIKTKGAGR